MKFIFKLTLLLYFLITYDVHSETDKSEEIKKLKDSLDQKEYIYIRIMRYGNLIKHPPIVIIYREIDFKLITELMELDLFYKIVNYHYPLKENYFDVLKKIIVDSKLKEYNTSNDYEDRTELHIFFVNKKEIEAEYEVELDENKIQLIDLLDVLLPEDKYNILEKLEN